MVHTYKSRVRKKALVRCLARSDSNINVEERRITTKLLKGALRETSLSEWPSFTEDSQLVHENVLLIAHSIFGYDPLQNFNLGI